MNLKVVQAAPLMRGFDTITRPTAAQYIVLAQFFDFAIRYLGDLHADEVSDALNAKLGLMLVQHARANGWMPDAAKGATDGARAVRDAQAINAPKGLTLWLDLEVCSATALFGDVQKYSEAACDQITNAGFKAGVYVGAGVPGSGQQLYELPFTAYWKSQSFVATPNRRAFQLEQLFVYPQGQCLIKDVWPKAPPNVASMQIDADVVLCDYLDGRPTMLVAA